MPNIAPVGSVLCLANCAFWVGYAGHIPLWLVMLTIPCLLLDAFAMVFRR